MQYTNTNRQSGQTVAKMEPNIQASRALVKALGISGKRPPNWTVCHIWGIDDPAFQKSNRIVQSPLCYSCIANMVWLPTPLKAFTDSMPQIKEMLRVCAFHLYVWVCDDRDVESEARQIKEGYLPDQYPESWPTADRQVHPPNVAPFSRASRNPSKIVKQRSKRGWTMQLAIPFFRARKFRGS